MPPRRQIAGPKGRFRLTISGRSGARHAPFLRRHLRAAHAILSPPLLDLSLALVGDRRMAALHEQFLHVRGPTDVLTFPLEHDRRGRPTAGEVVVCVPEAKRRAAVEGVSVERELLLYALHGMLHLAGFDDRTDPGFAAMHRTEDDILTRLGVGPVFSGNRGGAGRPGIAPGAGTANSRTVRRAARRPTMGARIARDGRTPRKARGS